MREVDITIDSLTESVIEQSTSQVFGTRIVSYSQLPDDHRLESTSWRFNWESESSIELREVFSLCVEGNMALQGLISLEEAQDHVFVHLIECAPHNIGENKLYEGVAGNLFAYACVRSFRLGHSGFVAFVAKSELVEHYGVTLGAQQIGKSQRMFIDAGNAQRLFLHYAKDMDKWP